MNAPEGGFVYVDTETTGFSRQDEVIEIAVIDDAGRVRLNTLIRPSRSIPYTITSLTGITNDMVRSAPRWDEAVPRIREAVGGRIVVAHNAAFDMRMTRGVVTAAAADVVCTKKMSETVFGRGHPSGFHSLQRLAGLAGHQDTQNHRALADTFMCRSVHRWLLPQMPALDARMVRDMAKPQSSDRKAVQVVGHRDAALADADDPRLVRVDPDLCPPPRLKGAPWDAAGDDCLAALWLSGAGVPEILEEIPRTPLAIFMRLERLGFLSAEHNPYNRPAVEAPAPAP